MEMHRGAIMSLCVPRSWEAAVAPSGMGAGAHFTCIFGAQIGTRQTGGAREWRGKLNLTGQWPGGERAGVGGGAWTK